ncbi:MAG: endonuclease III [Elusimicrobiales bacterium]|nr:endonuclease III [Elusimicrobiales bacterium]
MTGNARLAGIIKGLKKAYPDATCSLDHKSPYQLLVATILSAQCTDRRVNMTTPELFSKYPSPAAMAAAPPSDLERLVRSTGFYKSKARAIKEASRGIAEKFGGKVPGTMDELLTLRGVARKTANVVLGTAYGTAAGVVVDTHVKRVAFRLGLTRHTDPEKIERDLMKALPKEHWIWFAHSLVLHGRAVCAAARPRCGECVLTGYCPKKGVA